MEIDLKLKYPLHLRRYGDGRVIVVDMAWTEVAEARNYDHAYELVRLANCSYKLMNDLLEKAPYENPAKTPRNLGLTKAGAGISDSAGTDSP